MITSLNLQKNLILFYFNTLEYRYPQLINFSKLIPKQVIIIMIGITQYTNLCTCTADLKECYMP